MHEGLLRKTAKQIGVKLQGQPMPCQRCSEAKGIRKPVKPFTYTRATKPAERCFVDLSGPKSVEPMGGKEYIMIVIDDFLRFTRVFSSVPRRDSHAFSQVPGRNRSPQGRGGEE